MTELTAQERADVEALRLVEERERREYFACPHCSRESYSPIVMEYVTTLNAGNGQGWGAEYLFQCPNCKKIDVRDRTC